MNHTPKVRKRQVGILLILAAIGVGIVWYFTRDPTLEPIFSVLATLGTLLTL